MDVNDNKEFISEPEELTATEMDETTGGGDGSFAGGGSFGPFSKRFKVGTHVILRSHPNAKHAQIHAEPVVPGGPYQVYLYFGDKNGEPQIDIVEAYGNEIILKQ